MMSCLVVLNVILYVSLNLTGAEQTNLEDTVKIKKHDQMDYGAQPILVSTETS